LSKLLLGSCNLQATLRQEGLLSKLRAQRSEIAQLPEMDVDHQFSNAETALQSQPEEHQNGMHNNVYHYLFSFTISSYFFLN
jgi:hypothetical protein